MTPPKIPNSINSRVHCGQQSDTAPEDELSALLRELGDDEHGPSVDRNTTSLMARADKKGNVRLNAREVSALLEILGDLSKAQHATGYTLSTLAIATRNLHLGPMPSTTEATALSEVAYSQAMHASQNAERIRSIFSEIDTCPPNCWPNHNRNN